MADRATRDRTRKNHTATHLLQRALREVLGDHVTQQGSFVGPERLRFDFSHAKAMTPEEIEEVERRVNAQVIANATVETTIEDLEEAKARGVVALFGEKYDERVRVVDVGGWSTELCGGTHVRAAGDIGPFVIVSEGAIQAGVRRLEALTGSAAVEWIQNQKRQLTAAARALKVGPDELTERIEKLQAQVKEAKKKSSKDAKADVDVALQSVKENLADRGGVLVAAVRVPVGQAGLRELAGRVKGLGPDLAVLLIGADGSKAPWIALAEGAARERGVDARELVPILKEHLGGGGGGKPELCQGQGQDATGAPAAAEAVREALETTLG